MKLARLIDASAESRFVVSRDAHQWFPLGASVTTTPEAMAAVDEPAAVSEAFSGAGRSYDLSDLDCPVAGVTKIIGVGRNYSDHRNEMGREAPAAPILFTKWSNSLVGPTGDVIVDPIVAPRCDHEVELAVIVGGTVSNVARDDAMASVWGYAVANDVTSRDVQQASTTWDLSKGFDTFGPIGPWITTADEVPDWTDLDLTCTLNGVVVQSDKAGLMTFGVPELIEFISRSVTLMPGDVILTGTPAGVRAGNSEGPDRLHDGDRMTCEINGLGRIDNHVRMVSTAVAG